MRVIERSSADIEKETEELYYEIKPYLDKGYSVNRAVRFVKNKPTINTQSGWYKRLKEYVLEVDGIN